MQYDKTLCVVLLPAADCAIDLATADTGWLTGILNLKSQQDVCIVKQSDTIMCIRCSDFSVKHHILSWDTRRSAEEMFAIRVKDDLWKHERAQKAKMWPIMEALYSAGLRPAWSRASITWKTHEGRYFIHPGELPQSLSANDIVTYAKSGCTTLPTSQTIAQHVHSSCQTQVMAKSVDTQHQRMVTALKQDLALAKQRIAAQAIQCCFWRQKYKVLEARVGPPRTTKTSSSQTNTPSPTVEACVQTAGCTTHTHTTGVALKAHVSVQTDTPSQHSDDATTLTVQASSNKLSRW